MGAKDLSEEEKRLAKEYSEGNRFLEKALITCWENGIRTHACCGGHEKKYSEPYLGIIIDNDSLPYIERIINQLQDFKNILMRSTIRSGEGIVPEEGKTFFVQGIVSNRCELFSKIIKGINNKKEISLTDEAKRLFENVKFLNETNYNELLSKEQDGMVIGQTLSTASKELVEYRKMRTWSIWDKLLAKFLPKKRQENEKRTELKNKFEHMQNDYQEPLEERIIVDNIECESSKGDIQDKDSIQRDEDIEK